MRNNILLNIMLGGAILVGCANTQSSPSDTLIDTETTVLASGWEYELDNNIWLTFTEEPTAGSSVLLDPSNPDNGVTLNTLTVNGENYGITVAFWETKGVFDLNKSVEEITSKLLVLSYTANPIEWNGFEAVDVETSVQKGPVKIRVALIGNTVIQVMVGAESVFLTERLFQELVSSLVVGVG